jgi:hypothetical protein
MGGIGLGASLGGVAGGPAGLERRGLLPVSSMLALMAVAQRGLPGSPGPLRAHPTAAARTRPRAPTATGPLSGLRLLREVPYLPRPRHFVALGAATEAILDYVLNRARGRDLRAGPAILSFFALFHTGWASWPSSPRRRCSKPSLLGSAWRDGGPPAGGGGGGRALGRRRPRLWPPSHPRRPRRPPELALPLRLRAALHAVAGAAEAADQGHRRRGLRPAGHRGAAACSRSAPVLASGAAAAGARSSPGRGQRRGAIVGLPRLHRGYVSALEESLRSVRRAPRLAEVRDSTTLVTLARTGGSWTARPCCARWPRSAAAAKGARGAGAAAGADPRAPGRGRAALGTARGRAPRAAPAPGRATPRWWAISCPLLASNAVFLDVVRALRRTVAPRHRGTAPRRAARPRARIAPSAAVWPACCGAARRSARPTA